MHAIEIIIYCQRSRSNYLIFHILVISDLILVFMIWNVYLLCLKIIQSPFSVIKELLDIHDVKNKCFHNFIPVGSTHNGTPVGTLSLSLLPFSIILFEVFL
jgi:hypothetical protein